MNIKKSLLAVATASTVALAGTGVANAADGDAANLPAPQFSSEGSLDNVDLSDQAGALFGSVDGQGDFQLGQGIKGLAALVAAGAAVAGSISLIPNIANAVQNFQKFVDSITGQAAK